MVAFNSITIPWRDRLTKINDTTTYSQIQPWIDGLHAEGSTNTLAALRFALADPATEAIYLLTDGRPDQNERHILSQVQYRQTIPIHTIAFNCNDQAANQFLIDLAKQTGGRFHTFSYGFSKPTAIEIPESEDVGSLKQELMRGEKELERIAALRDECLGRAWPRDKFEKKLSKSKSQPIFHDDKPTSSQRRSQSSLDMNFRPQSASMPSTTNKKKRPKTGKARQRRSQSASNPARRSTIVNYNNDWLLPETKDYLNIKPSKEETKSDAETSDKVEAQPPQAKPPLTPCREVLRYLKFNSLVAKGLTIFDVLYPTSVTVKDPRHIQVIDRYVLAKVWDDILPLAYGSYVSRFRLVNHYAVDLEKYEARLRETIEEYYQFATKFIWKHLGDDAKRKLGPTLYWESLSKDEKTQITQEISRDEYTSQSALENFAWRKLTDQQQNDLLKKPIPYQDKNQALLKNALKAADAESALKGINRMNVEIHRATKFLQISTDLRQLQKRADSDAKPTADTKPPIKRRPSVDRNTHRHVICRFDADGFFHSGTIQKTPDGRTFVLFDMGIEQEAVGHILLPTNGAIAQPHICQDDCVLVRQINGGEEYWAPGIVRVLPSPVAQPPRLYMVQIYAPFLTEVNVSRRDILKISLGLYQRTVSYILSIHHRPAHTKTNKQPTGALLEKAVRKELQPIEKEVKKLHESYQTQCEHLETEIEPIKTAIKKLQDSMPAKMVRFQSAQPVEISLKPSKTEPEPSTPDSKQNQSPGPAPNPDPPNPVPIAPTSPEPGNSKPSAGMPKDFIQPNTHVYALWLEDDKFVHEGIVLDKESDSNSYRVKHGELPGVECIISRDDIFLQSERQRLKHLLPQSFALIEYPKNERNCWKPAVILSVDDEKNKTNVRFYDCIDEARSNNEYVIPISQKTFEKYSEYRIEFETSLINRTIVGLNKDKKMFMLGTVVDRIENGHTYTIQWCDQTQSPQEEEFIFGAFRRPVRQELDQIVLAIDDDFYIYKLAKILDISQDRKTLTVRFIDSEDTDREVDVSASNTFFVSESKHRLIKDKLKA